METWNIKLGYIFHVIIYFNVTKTKKITFIQRLFSFFFYFVIGPIFIFVIRSVRATHLIMVSKLFYPVNH